MYLATFIIIIIFDELVNLEILLYLTYLLIILEMYKNLKFKIYFFNINSK